MSWKKSTIGDVLSVIKNGINCEQNKIPVGHKITRIETIAKRRFDFERVGYANLSDSEREKSKLKIGDILFSHINSPVHVGKTALYDGEENIYHGINLLLLRTIDEVSPYFFNFYLNYLFVTGYWQKNCKKAVNQASVNQKDICRIGFSYPSLADQQKIVKNLNEIFSEIEKSVSATEVNIKNAELLFNSYLKSMKITSNWQTKTIGELCELMTGGTPSSNNETYYKNGNIPWLVSGDIHLEEINNCEGRITELGFSNSNAKYLPVNSVMIALNGQGKTRASVAMLRFKATCNQSLVSIYPKNTSEIVPDLIFYILKSRYGELRKITGDGGNDRRGLNMPLIRKIELTFPKSIDEQMRLIEKMKIIYSNALKMKNTYISKINSLTLLKNSILMNVFNADVAEVLQ